jgi:glycolate oxidase FAD binding subunit
MQTMHSMDHARQQLTDRIRAASADGTALHICGGGSKAFYGPQRQGQRLDTSALSAVLSYEPTELVVTVGAGTPLAELESLLAERGQCLPFEPPHFTWAASSGATVGGMVAAGLSGPARANAGAVREYVLGLRMVNGMGEDLTFGGQVMKNVAGYDVSRVLVGSMGTLGLITEVSLKVLPVAPAETTLVFRLNQHDALERLHAWGGQPLPLSASCWVHDTTVTEGAQDLLFVRLRGAVAAVEAACQTLMKQQGGGTRLENTQASADWQLCRNHQLPFFTQPQQAGLALWRLSVPQTAPVLDLPWAQLVEWHGGLRWLWAPADTAVQIQSMARSHGGSAILFIANGAYSTRANAQFDSIDPAEKAIQQRLKASFDPKGIFNPCKPS